MAQFVGNVLPKLRTDYDFTAGDRAGIAAKNVLTQNALREEQIKRMPTVEQSQEATALDIEAKKADILKKKIEVAMQFVPGLTRDRYDDFYSWWTMQAKLPREMLLPIEVIQNPNHPNYLDDKKFEEYKLALPYASKMIGKAYKAPTREAMLADHRALKEIDADIAKKAESEKQANRIKVVEARGKEARQTKAAPGVGEKSGSIKAADSNAIAREISQAYQNIYGETSKFAFVKDPASGLLVPAKGIPKDKAKEMIAVKARAEEIFVTEGLAHRRAVLKAMQEAGIEIKMITKKKSAEQKVQKPPTTMPFDWEKYRKKQG